MPGRGAAGRECFLEAKALAEYPFLQDWTDARFAELYDTLAQRLRAGYGLRCRTTGPCSCAAVTANAP
ncbi:hypothetical protein ACR3S4_29405 [Streptomyces sp. CH8.1]|uniref:hypothetical protein n=1 Tax=Streptomyces sp. CH8.1 TaxID=3439546 RepID=UPI003D9FC76D